MTSPETARSCPNCGMPTDQERFVVRRDGGYRCEQCYFKDTYLDGVVQGMETGYLVTLEAFVSAIDAREHEVGNHSIRVTEYSLVIGYSHGMRGRDLVDLYCGSLLHDIGKIGVPDVVLLKPGPLEPEEKTIMRKHPDIGYGIINRIGYFQRAAAIVRTHHERFDGSGYPLGLKGDEIPLGARVFAVADALDALTVTRPYHQALPFEDAVDVITSAAGTLFDPDVVQSFLTGTEELKGYIGRIFITVADEGLHDLTELTD